MPVSTAYGMVVLSPHMSITDVPLALLSPGLVPASLYSATLW